MNINQTTLMDEEIKTIVTCENCYQKIRIPRRKRKIRVTCPTCRHEFNYQYYALGISSSYTKPLIIGLIGGLLGFSLIELAVTVHILYPPYYLLSVIAMTILYSICLGVLMGTIEGFLKNDYARMAYGLKNGVIMGLVSGIISGYIAQIIFSAIIQSTTLDYVNFLFLNTVNLSPSFAQITLARAFGWSAFGMLIGLAYSIQEKTQNNIKSGLISGAFGGFIGGFLFDLLSLVVPLGEGTIGRLIGFSLLGMAIGMSTFRFKKVVIPKRPRYVKSDNKRVIYTQYRQNLPTTRDSLPPSSKSKLPPSSNSGPKLPPSAS